MSFESIRYEMLEDGIAAITLNRPERLNAINRPMMTEIYEALGKIDSDPDVRVFLLKGAPRKDGRPCFGAGVDLRAFAEGTGVDKFTGLHLCDDIDDLLKPSIAVVDGPCSTGAAELMLSCDFKVVAPSAQISDWHLKNLGTGLGGWGASTRWVKQVGPTRAKEIILTGKVVDGEEAMRIGLATAIHPSDELLEGALDLARAIAQMEPKGVALTLAHIDHAQDMSRDQAIRQSLFLPKWLGVQSGIENKADEVLGKKK
jgi:enoyl-CoA hydratase/carnithine racemase